MAGRRVKRCNLHIAALARTFPMLAYHKLKRGVSDVTEANFVWLIGNTYP